MIRLRPRSHESHRCGRGGVGLALLIILLVFSAARAQSRREEDSAPVIKLKEGWKYRWGDSPVDTSGIPEWTTEDLNDPAWKSASRRVALSGRKGRNHLWLRVRLPEETWENPALLLCRVFMYCDVYVGNEKIYSTPGTLPTKTTGFAPPALTRISLPDGFQGQVLSIRVFSTLPQFIGIEGDVLLGSRESLILESIRNSLGIFLIGFFCLFIGFMAFLIFFSRLSEKMYAVLAFGVFSFWIGAAFVTSVHVSMIFSPNPALLVYVLFLSFLLFPIGLMAFIDQVIGPGYRSVIRRLWQLHILIAFVIILLDVLSLRSLATWNAYLMYLWILDMVVSVWACIWASVKGQPEARIFMVGISIFSLFATHDLIRKTDMVLIHWGTLIFILLLGHLLIRRFFENRRRLLVYSRELEDKSATLEQAKVQLEDYSRTLEQKVEERTRALRDKNVQLEETLTELKETQNQLLIREKMASLGQLVAGIAHEINNPVGAVHSAADVSRRSMDKIIRLLARESPEDEIRSDPDFQKTVDILESNIETARLGTERIATLVQSLRKFARLDEAELKETDVHECLDTTLTLLQHQLKNRISVINDYGDLPPIQSYAGELNQVLMNLLSNASQAIPREGTIRIKTSVHGDRVRIEISDTGVGISRNNLEKIFDPGFTTKGMGVGMGLGLSMSYTIVQKHGGEIKVKSEPGKGSVFTVILPIRAA